MTEYKILIVDDEPNFIETMANIVEKAGESYEILSAVNGETAYNIATSQLPSIIITDWEMPYMSGLELIEKLKGNPKTKQIPIIMCTGLRTSSAYLMMAMEAGAVDYIRKPIDEIELLARIRSMLILVKSFKENERQKEELLGMKIELKNKELTSNTLHNIRNQETMRSVGEDLQKILETSDNEIIKEHIQSVIKKLNISSNQSVWEEFRRYFEKVHSSFFKNLQARSPALSQNEIKLCAFIKLNFSTKDISSITGQIPHSIDVARYRIRKKLNLQHKETLFIFLSEL